MTTKHGSFVYYSLSTHLWLSSLPAVCLPQVPMEERSAPRRRSCFLPEYYTFAPESPPSHNFPSSSSMVVGTLLCVNLSPPGGSSWMCSSGGASQWKYVFIFFLQSTESINKTLISSIQTFPLRCVKHTTLGPKPSRQRTSCENHIDINWCFFQVAAIPNVSTGGRAVFTERWNNRGNITSVSSSFFHKLSLFIDYSTSISVVRPTWN